VIRSVLIANRGEIAVRIIRAARTLGIRTVQVYSAADRDMLAVRMADEAIDIGSPAPKKSYLNITALLDAARKTGVDAIHPGYGFLSENANFADEAEASGIIFIGPRSDTIRLLGDKVAARALARQLGVPTVPGSEGRLYTLDDARTTAARCGYPVMIKAAAGGGGRGIRIVEDEAELVTQFPLASAEAAAAFGDGGLYLEKAVQKARHIEVQIFGDGKDVIHFFERECSLQRRRQKVWEEACALSLPGQVQARLYESALTLARVARYRGAGTVEYLYDEETHEFYFIEVNTRIQVEHPVTEMVTGFDLVQEMFKVAGGAQLSRRQAEITAAGHAIECRINAEDPSQDFMPAPGCITRLVVPEGKGIRFDSMLYEGYTVPPFYDSLLGKLVVWGETREDCLSRLSHALDELIIEGVPTTIPLHQGLAADTAVREGRIHTRFLENWIESAFPRGDSVKTEVR
jgi:acetyl-CoA carboxylase biotin carboxylase subunit